MINVTRSSMPDFSEYCEQIRPLWDSHWLTNAGCMHQRLEQALCAYLGAEHLSLYVNGHLALENILAAMRFPEGAEVLTTPFTFASTTHAIVRCGLTPVFCDIEPEHYTLDPAQLEALITPKTAAIVPVHVYGNLCDTDAIGRIAAAHGLKVIYDAAHAFGVARNGISAACFGDAAMFSFHATKVFNTIEGGAVCYRDAALTPVLNALRNFGMTSQEDAAYIGGNAKMNEFAAAMGICNLRHLDAELEKRRLVVERYRAHLSGVPGLRLCAPQEGVRPNYAYFPVLFDGFRRTRDEVFDQLLAQGICARKYFYPTTNSFSCYRGRAGFDPARTPVAVYMAQRVLTLPLYADLAPEDVDRICEIVLT